MSEALGPIPHAPSVRCSILPDYPDCNRRCAARLFWREITAAGHNLRRLPKGIGAAVGTSVHASAALTLKEKAAYGSLAPMDVVTDCAVETYRMQAQEELAFDRETPDGRVAEKQVIRMAEKFQECIRPDVEPILVEEKLEADTGFGVILDGHADLVAREPGRIRDLKTGKRLGVYTAQIGGYSLLARSNALEIEAADIDYLKRVPLGKEQPPVVTKATNLGIAEASALLTLKHIARSLELYREGDPDRHIEPGRPEAFLSNPSSYLCSPKYCSAFGTSWCQDGAAAHSEKEIDL